MTASKTFTRLGLFGSGAALGLILGPVLNREILPKHTDTAADAPLKIPIDTTSPHYPPNANLPSHENVHIREAFTCSMNYRTKIPNWVAEHLTQSWLNQKNGDRKRASFKQDDDIPETFRAHNKDYWDSGWSRGHLAAAGTHRATQEAQDSTFLLNSNIVPQDMSMNGCDWNRIEVLVRDLVKEFDDVYVLSGPLWIPERHTTLGQRPFSRNKVLIHEVVGEGMVHVPTHLYKIILVRQGAATFSAAFLVPNRPIKEEKPLDSYIVRIEDIEKLTGLDLHGLKTLSSLCAHTQCNRKENRRMRGWRLYGYIDDSRDLEGLREAVRMAIDEGFVGGDNFLIPKVIRDRMNDLKLSPEPRILFPEEERYRAAVEAGFQNFISRPVPKDAVS